MTKEQLKKLFLALDGVEVMVDMSTIGGNRQPDVCVIEGVVEVDLNRFGEIDEISVGGACIYFDNHFDGKVQAIRVFPARGHVPEK